MLKIPQKLPWDVLRHFCDAKHIVYLNFYVFRWCSGCPVSISSLWQLIKTIRCREWCVGMSGVHSLRRNLHQKTMETLLTVPGDTWHVKNPRIHAGRLSLTSPCQICTVHCPLPACVGARISLPIDAQRHLISLKSTERKCPQNRFERYNV